jgi:2-keto-4-pentenoate hydratase/2-oxohepta-3-ene-1,7-dioic acid hydratase in catechol pathway
VVHDPTPLTGDIDGASLVDRGVARARDSLDEGWLTPLDTAGLRIGAPVARPSAVLCIGQNYAAHAAETGDPPPTKPMLFFKHPNTVVGPNDDVMIPPRAVKVDWEVELEGKCCFNGEPRQDSTTKDMVFTVSELVWHLSQFLVLEPGDIINIGTPQGVALSGRFPYLVEGDVMKFGIDGLGTQRQRMVAAVPNTKDETHG